MLLEAILLTMLYLAVGFGAGVTVFSYLDSKWEDVRAKKLAAAVVLFFWVVVLPAALLVKVLWALCDITTNA